MRKHWWEHSTRSTVHVDNGVCSTSDRNRMCLHCQGVHERPTMYRRAVSPSRKK